ncbi:MAG TPA: peptidoglycan-associated lipoprotein Pal [Dongiaceae bacterium]|nr:peptidoglycan-associated lipoprotein Pal [Dongiaceae bacterium]
MSETYANARRPLATVGLLLALGLLAACESKSGTQQQPVTNPGMANLSPVGTGTVDQNPQQTLRDRLTQVGDRVLFATDQYEISPAAEGILRTQAGLLAAYPAVTVTIEGHADERGTREYNLALADRRAASVRNYLTALGVAPERIETVSYGKERPECVDASESCWAENRRGVTVVNQ